MAEKRIGNFSIKFQNPPTILSSAAIAGTKEAEGRLASYYDQTLKDERFGEDSWEKAESKMQKETLMTAVSKGGISLNDLDYIFAGDLLNQCSGSHYGMRETSRPFLGLYGACSTMAESMAMGAMVIDGGYADHAACITSSHFCGAEKQYRYPLEYGGQRPPTAQWTVTGSGCAVLAASGDGPFITGVTIGRIVDMGITDANNMGAAMAPAAYDTLNNHLADHNIAPDYYDLILTGDLAEIGSGIVRDMFRKDGIDLSDTYMDCGNMVFYKEEQDVHAGASGCGCSAVVFCSYIMDKLKKGELNKVLFIGTGALMNPGALTQGESIPAIAHAVSIERSLT